MKAYKVKSGCSYYGVPLRRSNCPLWTIHYYSYVHLTTLIANSNAS